MNRRTVLKSLGAATTLSTAGVAVSSARSGPDFEKIFEQSHRILEKAGPEKQHKFLRSHDVGTAMTSGTYNLGGKVTNNGGVSEQELLYSSDITLTFSLYKHCSNYLPDGTFVAELTWEYDSNSMTLGNPMDHVGIGWDNNTWYYANNNKSDMYSGSSYINYIEGTSGLGPAWSVNDSQTVPSSTDYYYSGVHLKWNGTQDEKSNRTIAASYSHTWNEVTITGIGVSYPYGVSVSVGNQAYEWEKSTNDNGDFLRLRYSDINGGC